MCVVTQRILLQTGQLDLNTKSQKLVKSRKVKNLIWDKIDSNIKLNKDKKLVPIRYSSKKKISKMNLAL